jgi:tRNA-2-methylthio-N6-dimethylallyladenosine synthase
VELEKTQAEIATKQMALYQGRTVEVLVEDQSKDKWRGRNEQNKLVYFEDTTTDWMGKLARVEIDRTSPWSLSGHLPGHAPSTVASTAQPIALV